MVDTHIAVEPVVGPQNTSWVQFLAVLAQYDHQNTSVVDLMVDPMVDHGRGGHFHGRPRGRVVALFRLAETQISVLIFLTKKKKNNHPHFAVRRVRHEPTHKLFALKIISFGSGMTRKVLQTELSRCSNMDKHPNLVASLEAYFKEGMYCSVFQLMLCDNECDKNEKVTKHREASGHLNFSFFLLYFFLNSFFSANRPSIYMDVQST